MISYMKASSQFLVIPLDSNRSIKPQNYQF